MKKTFDINDHVFYVYCYCDPRKKYNMIHNGFFFEYEPIYIGFGKNNRINAHLNEAKKILESNIKINFGNKLKINKLLKILSLNLEPIIIKLVDNLIFNESTIIEKELIKNIGRIDNKTGPLTNLTDGGEGCRNLSIESRLKISKANKERYINGGFNSLEYREKLSDSLKKSFQRRRDNNLSTSNLNDEARKKISISLKGNIPVNKGIPMSKEQKEKISIKSKLSVKKQITDNKGKFIKKTYIITNLETNEIIEIIGSRNFYNYCRINKINRELAEKQLDIKWKLEIK